jgi:glycosyltransferase involved in cell wall biosynthesis
MKTLIVFSHLRWGSLFQRPHHLMRELARHYHIVFIEEPRLAERPRLERSQPHANVDVLVPHTPVDAPGFDETQVPYVREMVEDYVGSHSSHDRICWLYTPMALPLIANLRRSLLVYDCMDELAAFKGPPQLLRGHEAELLAVADLVLTGGPSLYQARRTLHPHVYCLPSAVDAEHFAPASLRADSPHAAAAHALQGALGRPRLGYAGVIDERMDLALLDAMAQARPQWQIVLAGPVARIDEARLPRRANLHWLGMQPYARLPYLLQAWDVCLMPFAINDATRYICPTKTLEYLAAEKPVVGTAVSDVISLYGHLVGIARGHDEFIDACDAALALTPRQRLADADMRLASLHHATWQQLGVFIHELLSATPAEATRAQEIIVPRPVPVAAEPLPVDAKPLPRSRVPAALLLV